jgi:hypothetical protein
MILRREPRTKMFESVLRLKDTIKKKLESWVVAGFVH